MFTDPKNACLDSVVSAKHLFREQYGGPAPEFYESLKLKLALKVNHEYKLISKTKGTTHPINIDFRED